LEKQSVFRRFDDLAALHHKHHVLKGGHTLGWVVLNGDEIAVAPDCYRA